MDVGTMTELHLPYDLPLRTRILHKAVTRDHGIASIRGNAHFLGHISQFLLKSQGRAVRLLP